MICIARILGAPLTVPAGKVARIRSKAVLAGRDPALHLGDDVHHVRVALDDHEVGHVDEPNAQTRPMSLRARSTSIRCSARSFSSASSSFSSASVLLRRSRRAGACPAIGPDLDQAVGQADVHLRRGPDQREVARCRG